MIQHRDKEILKGILRDWLVQIGKERGVDLPIEILEVDSEDPGILSLKFCRGVDLDRPCITLEIPPDVVIGREVVEVFTIAKEVADRLGGKPERIVQEGRDPYGRGG